MYIPDLQCQFLEHGRLLLGAEQKGTALLCPHPAFLALFSKHWWKLKFWVTYKSDVKDSGIMCHMKEHKDTQQ